MGSVEINVVNRNLIDNDSITGQYNCTVENKIIKASNTSASSWFRISFDNIILETDDYVISLKAKKKSSDVNYILKNIALYDKDNSDETRLIFNNINKVVKNEETLITIPVKITRKISSTRIFFQFGTSITNQNIEIREIMISKGQNTNIFINKQSQTAIMPIQQEMLSGDYVADVEHHEWGKLVLDENSDIECVHSNTAFQFRFLKYLEGTGSTTKTICNMAKYWNIGEWGENGCFVSWNGYFYILCKENEFGFNADMTTDEALAHFKAILANNKLIAYYQLPEPVDLELTEEQKAIRDTKLYTYKNVTNISLSDKLASIDIDYKKDFELKNIEQDKNIKKNTDAIKKINESNFATENYVADAVRNIKDELDYYKDHVFDETEFTDVTNNYQYTSEYMYSNGNTAPDGDSNSKTTDYLTVEAAKSLFLTGHTQFGTALICIFDSTKKCIGSFPASDIGDKTYSKLKVSDYVTENTYYIKLSSYNAKIKLEIEQRISNSYVLNDLRKMNVLYGKKMTFCGDSFTVGDFTDYIDENGKSGISSDAYDKKYGMYKTYPYHIAQRNNVDLKLLAKCGAQITKNSSNCFTSPTDSIYYENIPTDSDYIIIAFGLNDSNKSIGSITDNDNTTWYGAFNVVMNWIVNNIPKAKVLLIASDAWYSNIQRDCVKNVAQYWGVGFLDLKGPDVPMMLGGKYSQDGYIINSDVVTLKNNQFKIATTNEHPNLFAHKFRSTIIENALRKL